MNKLDNTGSKKPDDSKTFKAVTEAFGELYPKKSTNALKNILGAIYALFDMDESDIASRFYWLKSLYDRLKQDHIYTRDGNLFETKEELKKSKFVKKFRSYIHSMLDIHINNQQERDKLLKSIKTTLENGENVVVMIGHDTWASIPIAIERLISDLARLEEDIVSASEDIRKRSYVIAGPAIRTSGMLGYMLAIAYNILETIPLNITKKQKESEKQKLEGEIKLSKVYSTYNTTFSEKLKEVCKEQEGEKGKLIIISPTGTTDAVEFDESTKTRKSYMLQGDNPLVRANIGAIKKIDNVGKYVILGTNFMGLGPMLDSHKLGSISHIGYLSMTTLTPEDMKSKSPKDIIQILCNHCVGVYGISVSSAVSQENFEAKKNSI